MKFQKNISRFLCVFALLTFLFFLVPWTAQAATCTWDGSVGDWGDIGHWSCAAVPGAGDAVVISSGEVTVTSDVQVDNLTFTGGILWSDAIITVASSMSWSGGALFGSGSTFIPVGAMLSVGGTALKTLGGSHLLNNQGTITWSGTGVFYVSQNSTAVIENHGLFDVQTDSLLGSGQISSTAAFNNYGILRKSSGAGVVLVASVLTFNNFGSVQVQVGTLNLQTGGISSSSGDFQISSGAVLQFNGGTHNLAAVSLITGAGQVLFSGGTVNLAGAYTLTGLTTVSGGIANFNNLTSLIDLDLIGGELSGSGTITTTGTLDWTGGWLSGSGKSVIAPGAQLNVSGGSVKTLAGSRLLENQGTLTWSGSGIFSVNQNAAAVIQNEGLFDVQTDSVLGSGQINTTAALVNHGIFRKSGGPGTTLVAPVLTFNNYGIVEVLTGTLQLQTGATSTSGGDFEVSEGADLRFTTGVHHLEAASSLTGAGEVIFNGANVDLAGVYSVSGLTSIQSGIASFESALSVAFANLEQSGGSLMLDNPGISLSGDFTRSNGSFQAGTGTLTVNGGTQQAFTLDVPTIFYNLSVTSGTTLVEIVATDNALLAGALSNDGLIRKTKLVVPGANTFGLTGVAFEVTIPGSLSAVTVDRVGQDHPHASGQTSTGQYWVFTSIGENYTLDLSLPHAIIPDTNAQACRYSGSGLVWDCDRTDSTASIVTRSGVTQLSEWAAGDIAETGYTLYLPLAVSDD